MLLICGGELLIYGIDLLIGLFNLLWSIRIFVAAPIKRVLLRGSCLDYRSGKSLVRCNSYKASGRILNAWWVLWSKLCVVSKYDGFYACSCDRKGAVRFVLLIMGWLEKSSVNGYSEMIEHMREGVNDLDSIPARVKMAFYHFLFSVGEARVGLLFRDASITQLYSGVADPGSTGLSLSDNGKKGAGFAGGDHWDRCCSISIFGGAKEDIRGRVDCRFQDLIAGKSVAIVGPAPPTQKYGVEIDLFDVVIRSGYRGHLMRMDPDYYGSKTHVSYYGSGFSRLFVGGDRCFLDELDFAVFKSICYDYQYDMYYNSKARVKYSDDSFVSGSPLEIINIVYDVLRFGPGRIKIFNANFYLSEKTHADGYSPHHGSPSLRRLVRRGLADHDVISSIDYLRGLYVKGAIDASDELKSILLSNNEAYCSAFDAYYADV